MARTLPLREHWWMRVWRYACDDYVTDPAKLRENRNKGIFGAVVAALLLIPFGWMTALGPEGGIPLRSTLVAVSGRLIDVDKDQHHVVLTIEGRRLKFDYMSKAGAFRAVANVVCLSCEVTVWIDPAHNEKIATIFQLTVNGRMVRSYDEIRTAWSNDNRLSPWLFGGFLLGGIYLGWYARRQHMRLLHSIPVI